MTLEPENKSVLLSEGRQIYDEKQSFRMPPVHNDAELLEIGREQVTPS